MLDDIITKLQKELDLAGPLGGANAGSFALMLDDIKVSIIETNPGFELAAVLGELPRPSPELFMAKMLRGNLFGQATEGAIVGLDETGTRITLRYYYPLSPTYRDLKEKLEDFMNVIDFWQGEVKRHIENPNSA
jgi:hypothetical protein